MRSGEAVLGVVGDGEGVVEVLRLDDGEDGAEDLFERDAGGGSDVGDDGGRDVKAAFGIFDCVAAGEDTAFGLADVDVVEDLVVGGLVDDGAGVEVFCRVALLDLADAIAQHGRRSCRRWIRRRWRGSRRSTSGR